jgi:hypothetical protein
MMFDTIMGWLTKYILENICSMFLLNFLGKIYRSIFPEFNLIIFKQASIVKNLLTSSVNICLRTVIIISKRSYSGGFNITKKSYLKLKKKFVKNNPLHDKKQKQFNFKKQILNKFLLSGDADQTKMENFISLKTFQTETCPQVYLNNKLWKQETLQQDTLQQETLLQETLQHDTLQQETLLQKTLQQENFAARNFAARNSAARNFAARNFAARNFAARNFAARNFAARNFAARNFAARNFAARNFAARNFAARNFAARNFAARNFAARNFTGKNYSVRNLPC